MSDLSELFEQLADGPVLLATAFDSLNVDCDNGATLHSMPRGRRRDGGTAHRLAFVEACEEANSLLPPSGRRTQVGTTSSIAFRAIVGPESRVEIAVVL